MPSPIPTVSGEEWRLMVYGALVSVPVTAIVVHGARQVRNRLLRTSVARTYRSIRSGNLKALRSIERATNDPTSTLIGAMFTFPWVSIAYGPFRTGDIRAEVSQTRKRYKPEVESWRKGLLKQISSPGNSPFYNSEGLGLVRFETRLRAGAEERPTLNLQFVLTDFVASMASDQRLDLDFVDPELNVTTIRKKYFRDHDLRKAPYPGVSCHFGIQLAVITSDSKLIIPTRGDTMVSRGLVAPSVAEGALPTSDAPAVNSYDPNRTALRGLAEELGVLSDPPILWLSFGANWLTGQYALVGLCRLDESFEDVAQLHRAAVPRDNWENASIESVEFSPEGLRDYVIQHPKAQWSPFACVAFTHALVHEFGLKHVARCLGNLSISTTK